MRVAYVCLDPGVPVFGRKGCSIHCQEVMRALIQRGCQIDLFTRRLGNDIPPDLSGIKIHQMGGKLDRDRAIREKTMAHSNPIVVQMLRDAGPFDLVYERFSLWNCAAMQYAREQRVPGILEVNSPLIHEQKTYRSLIDESAAKSIQGTCFKNATSIIAVSDQVADQIRNVYFAKDKTTVIPNGVNCERFQTAGQSSARNTENLTIGFVGTLKPWHGVSILLNAFAKVRSSNSNVRLNIVGDGPERQKLEDRLQRFSAELQQSVNWTGAIPSDQVPQILDSFDIAVAPYPDLQDFYFSPLKILEYMAARLPIVASRIGQIPSLIEHNQSGLLVKSGCQAELATSLLRLSQDQELRSRLGTAARKKAESNHTWQSVVDRILRTVPLQMLHCEAC